MNIGYITSWEADQTISFKVGRSINSGAESTIVEDLFIGNGNAAGPAVAKWHLDFIDQPSTTDSIEYKLYYKLNGTDYDYVAGIIGQNGITPITSGNTYKMYNSIFVESI